MAETGLNQNYFRDYDPIAGRYIESDPIGLEAGVNTYAYVYDSPLGHVDATGQDGIAIPLNPGPTALPGWLGPASRAAGAGGAVAGAGWLGWQIGSGIYPYIASPLGSAIDTVCHSKSREEICEENLERDMASCRALGRKYGKQAYEVCRKQAMLRYGNCLSGRDSGIDAPLPPWGG
jgi:hypothetical protein